ncbi:MAG: ATP-dependent zinc metalloprotease FtsH [Oscillospiraceae bacterium]|nr:ATP-dependent zinc metalloprotease FtsH [Oscillospiraceae bacterium]
MNKKKTWINILIYAGIPILIYIVMTMIHSSKPQKTYIYSEIVGHFKNQNVLEYRLNLGSREMKIKLKNGQELKYEAPSVIWLRDDIKEYIKEYNSNNPDSPMKQNIIPPAETPWFLSIIPTLIFSALAILPFFLMRRYTGGIIGEEGKPFSFGKSKIKNMANGERKATFAEVAGADEEKEELQEVVDFLQSPNKYNDLGARIPKGVLLIGPPGTGKTLLARAIAGEADVPFFSISGSEFVEMYVGLGASRVRDLFEQGKKNAPCIVFIDEIDAVGRHRGSGHGGAHDEREQTLNQLLVEMDGFGTNEGVVVIAATNRGDVLDRALLRPGRFDRQVVVGLPDIKGREDILKVHAKGKPLAPDVVLKTIAQSTTGFTGADLANVLNEAALLAARKGFRAITMSQIEEATVKVIMGTEKKSKVIKDADKKITAYHEAGHAVVTYYCKNTDEVVQEISIIPRGMAGGYTFYRPEEDKTHLSKKEMEETIISLLGGRVAEALVIGDIHTGASEDISRATEIARDMVMKYGMSTAIGPIHYSTDNDDAFVVNRNYSEKVAGLIDEEVQKIISEGYDKTESILKKETAKLHKIAEYLIKNEKMNGEKFREVMEE